MDIRAQLAMVFNLDKCLGCHTCSIACKNVWTDRRGAEYMWWNNVETKPGTGYPRQWEDQDRYKGGWMVRNGKLKLKGFSSRLSTLLSIFHQPNMPSLDRDYYHPWDYDYGNLAGAPRSNDQPTAEPVSAVTGEPMKEIKRGPNWDDDLSGSTIHAARDIGLRDRTILDRFSEIFMAYLPRICNHCLNPACVAACPSRAIYKRGEDGIVLVDQEACKGWRFCVSACPYKKVYYNWETGKSEKCIFCFPRTETGQCNACAHNCVGRIRYVGVLLTDVSDVPAGCVVPDDKLVAEQRKRILDPRDESVREAARAAGIPESWLTAAAQSPVYRLVREFGVALPLHPEFRTMPMMYYIPPLSPILASEDLAYEIENNGRIPDMESLRIPVDYLAGLLSGGNREIIEAVLRRLIAVRIARRNRKLGDDGPVADSGLKAEQMTALYRLMTVASYDERFVIPPRKREESDPLFARGKDGFGLLSRPRGM